jgi:hypothetical protein
MTNKSAKEIDLVCLANTVSQDIAAIRVILEYILSRNDNFDILPSKVIIAMKQLEWVGSFNEKRTRKWLPKREHISL